jgi:hypothetical protein
MTLSGNKSTASQAFGDAETQVSQVEGTLSAQTPDNLQCLHDVFSSCRVDCIGDAPTSIDGVESLLKISPAHLQ